MVLWNYYWKGKSLKNSHSLLVIAERQLAIVFIFVWKGVNYNVLSKCKIHSWHWQAQLSEIPHKNEIMKCLSVPVFVYSAQCPPQWLELWVEKQSTLTQTLLQVPFTLKHCVLSIFSGTWIKAMTSLVTEKRHSQVKKLRI